MPTLTADLPIDQEYLRQVLPSGFYTVDDEHVLVTSEVATERDPDRQFGELRAVGSVIRRGVGGSDPAAHSAGATITEYSPAAPGGDSEGGGFANPATVPLDMNGHPVSSSGGLNRVDFSSGDKVGLISQQNQDPNVGRRVEVWVDQDEPQVQLRVFDDGAVLQEVKLDDNGLTLNDARVVAVLTDPGVAWQAEVAFAQHDRISVSSDRGTKVFKAGDVLGPSGTVEPAWATVLPGGQIMDDGIQGWQYLGFVGEPEFSVTTLGVQDQVLRWHGTSGFGAHLVQGAATISTSLSMEITATVDRSPSGSHLVVTGMFSAVAFSVTDGEVAQVQLDVLEVIKDLLEANGHDQPQVQGGDAGHVRPVLYKVAGVTGIGWLFDNDLFAADGTAITTELEANDFIKGQFALLFITGGA